MLGLLLLALAPAPAHAAAWEEALAPPARAHLRRAVKFYAEHDYGNAAEAFRSAYRIDPAPKLLFSIAQALRLAGRCPEAVEAYSAFLEAHPEAEAAKLARENMALCAEAPPPEPPVRPLPDVMPAPAPTPDPATDVTQALAAPAPPPARIDTATAVLLGAAGASLVGSVVFAVLERNSVASRDAAITFGDFERADDRARTQRVVAISLGGVALTCGAIATWRLLSD